MDNFDFYNHLVYTLGVPKKGKLTLESRSGEKSELSKEKILEKFQKEIKEKE